MNFFITYAFGVTSKKSLPNLQENHSTVFLRVLRVLAITFTPMIHFELIFVYGVS